MLAEADQRLARLIEVSLALRERAAQVEEVSKEIETQIAELDAEIERVHKESAVL